MIIGWDIETTGLKPWADDARVLSMSTFGEPYATKLADVPGGQHWQTMLDLLADPDNILVGHNLIGFDLPYFEAHHGPIKAKVFDTRVSNALIDETGMGNSLAELAAARGIALDQSMKKKRKKLADVPVLQLLKYNAEDAKASYYVGLDQMTRVYNDPNMTRLMNWLMQVGQALKRMVATGVIIDRKWVSLEAQKMGREIERLETAFNSRIGRPTDEKPAINVRSADQLRKLFFEDLDMPTDGLKRTKKTREISMDKQNLLQLAKNFKKGPAREWFQLLLDHRELSKMKGTYLEPLAGKHLGADGRVHTFYHLGRGYGASAKLGGTVTGRLSSSDPNLQNMPRDTRVKGAVVPTAGWKLFEADYAQLEIRVAAWYAGEQSMLDAFDAGRDIHTDALAQVEGKTYEYVVDKLESGDKHWKEQRALIKRINFGTLYGASTKKIREMLADMGVFVSYYKASDMRKRWFSTYANITAWITAVENEIRINQQVTTPTGRVRHLPEILSADGGERAGALRQGVNFMVQSLASDVTLTAIELLDDYFLYRHDGRLLLTVHDSVVGEYLPYNDVVDSSLFNAVKYLMVTKTNETLGERFGTSPLPLATDLDTGMGRWGASE